MPKTIPFLIRKRLENNMWVPNSALPQPKTAEFRNLFWGRRVWRSPLNRWQCHCGTLTRCSTAVGIRGIREVREENIAVSTSTVRVRVPGTGKVRIRYRYGYGTSTARRKRRRRKEGEKEEEGKRVAVHVPRCSCRVLPCASHDFVPRVAQAWHSCCCCCCCSCSSFSFLLLLLLLAVPVPYPYPYRTSILTRTLHNNKDDNNNNTKELC